VYLARTRSPLAVGAGARRLLAEGRGRTDAASPNPTAEWRRENYGRPLDPDVFATLQLPIDLTGRRLALRQAASAATRRGAADSSAAIRQLELDVLRAFWRASLASELAEIAREERDARTRTAAFDAQRFQAGSVAEVVAMRGQLEADRARIAAAAADGEVARARADLARLLGTDALQLGALASVLPPGAGEIGVADTSWQAVRGRRPDLQALRLAVEEAERRERAESRGLIGDVNVVGGYKGTGGYSTGLLGILVPLPLFNRNEGPRLRVRAEHQLSRAEHADAELRVRTEVDAAVRAYEATRIAGQEGAATLSARAAEIARIAEATYREGAISSVELLEAQRARAESRAQGVRWAVDMQLAWLDVRRATGLPLLPSLPTP
jgi:cobalt-zinc-cadmium efflux system outer membrane protein